MLDKVKFLLVDDIEDNLVVLEALLRRDDLQILTARSGTEALELLLDHEVALAFIEVQMPNMDGFELAELMRGAERSKHIPIIFVSAALRDPHRVFKGYESGAVDFLFKPIDPEILRHKANTFFELFRQKQLLAEQLKRIQTNEALLRAVMDSTSAVIYIKDLRGRYITVNRRFEVLFDLQREALRGKGDSDIFPEDVVASLRANDLRVLEGGEFIEVEEVVPHNDGPHTYVSCKVPLRDAAGNIWALCGVSTDITERKRLEVDLARAVQAREDVLAVVSHDLRNPLSVIDLTVAVLLKGSTRLATEGQLTVQYERIQRSVALMHRMLGDLSDLANIRSGRLSIQRQMESVATLIEEAIVAQESLARERGLSLKSEIAPNLPQAELDRTRILQVFANLLGNALKFCPADGSILVRADADDVEVRFVVIDSGPGIAESDLPHVFDPYWSAKKDEKNGSGLGLYISKGIVEAHGGRIWIESQPLRGTAVHFTLPRVR